MFFGHPVYRCPNQLYLSFSEENPDSFTAGKTPNFYQDSNFETQKTTFKNIKTGKIFLHM